MKKVVGVAAKRNGKEREEENIRKTGEKKKKKKERKSKERKCRKEIQEQKPLGFNR